MEMIQSYGILCAKLYLQRVIVTINIGFVKQYLAARAGRVFHDRISFYLCHTHYSANNTPEIVYLTMCIKNRGYFPGNIVTKHGESLIHVLLITHVCKSCFVSPTQVRRRGFKYALFRAKSPHNLQFSNLGYCCLCSAFISTRKAEI